MPIPPYVGVTKKGSVVHVFVQPRAAKDELVGVHGHALKLKVKAPPEEGRANRAACELVAGLLGVASREVEVVSGAASRNKKLAVPLPPAEVVARIEPVLSSRGPRAR